jgi:hypothetical protein
LPFSPWHGALCASVALAMAGLAAHSSLTADLLRPEHVSELASILRSVHASDGAITVRRTSLAVGVSVERFPRYRDSVVLYSLSRAGRPLTEREAAALARVIVDLGPRSGDRHRLLPGGHDVFHLVAGGTSTS